MRRFAKTVICEGEEVLFVVTPCLFCEQGHWLTTITARSSSRWESADTEHFSGGGMEATLEEQGTERRAARILKAERMGAAESVPLSNTRH